MKKPIITIVGSINMDLVVTSMKRPLAGETILGNDFKTVSGGKGANQAVAASRLGAEVHMIGRVGSDNFGSILTKGLKEAGIFLDDVEPVTDVPTGVALITLAENDNSIIVVQGANKYVTPEYVRSFEDLISKSDVVLTQLEIPIESVEETAILCHKHKTTFILNPAPAQELSQTLLGYANYITPNEVELKQLSSMGTIDIQQYPKKLIVTEGKKGVVYSNGQGIKRIPSFAVPTVDTTGAGDTFNGAFGYAISQNEDVNAAIQFANAAAALSVQKMGAQGGMPIKSQVTSFLCEQGKENIASLYELS